MASLDMTLDDMIKSRRKNERGRGRGKPQRGRRAGGSFRGGRPAGAPRGGGPLGVNSRPSANTIAKSFRRVKNLPWQNGLFEDSLRAAGLSSGLESGTKLYVSNLDSGVTNEDIRELFSEIGELIRYAIHFDKNGCQSGSAEVVFARRSDAFQALKKYNNVQLDGKPMNIEIVGTNSQVPVLARVNVGRVNGKRTVVMNGGQGLARPRNGGAPPANWGSGRRGQSSRGGRGRGGSGGRGRGGFSRRKKGADKSADQLDKELDSYHSEAMQTE